MGQGIEHAAPLQILAQVGQRRRDDRLTELSGQNAFKSGLNVQQDSVAVTVREHEARHVFAPCAHAPVLAAFEEHHDLK